jgi:FAD binding domain
MARKRDTGRDETKRQEKKALSRRDFFTRGAAAGVGVSVLSGPGEARAQGIRWDYEADVVVLGSGCVGLHAAVRARDLGASVLVIDQNFDVGGKLVHSGGWTSLGGGDAIQERDRMAADPQGLGLTAPRIEPQDLEDDPDRLFRDMTDWSVVDATGVARYRYNDRELHRAWADNAPKVRQFMMDNHIRFARIDGTHQGGGVSRARAARAIMKMADKTDIKAGTLSPQDRGDPAAERHSPFNPMRTIPGGGAAALGAPGWVFGGFVIARSLEFSAREKGIRFMLNRHMDEIIREQPFSGRVLGVKASYTPRMHPETGARLESYWQNGNIDERADTIYIRARKAVIVGTGGMHGSVPLRTMIDPRMVEPSIEYGPSSLIGPRNMDGSGIIAGMKIGANLAGMMQNYQHSLASPTISSVLGTRDAVASIFPGHPAFLFARAKGIAIGNAGWEHVIAVNQMGQRF